MKREKNGSPFFSGQTVWQTKGIKHGAHHYSEKVPYFRDQVPPGTFLTFWVPIYISGSLVQCFGFNKHIECQLSLHVHNNMSTLVLSVTGNFLHYYCVL